MKHIMLLLLIGIVVISCSEKPAPLTTKKEVDTLDIEGTWKRISAQNIVKDDTTFVDYTQGIEGIKIIGKDHFAFFQHDLNQGKDSTAQYSSGAGRYELEGNQYIEYLDYCQAREWENHKFEFTVEIRNDSLFQTGIEKVPSIGVDRVIIETYVRAINAD